MQSCYNLYVNMETLYGAYNSKIEVFHTISNILVSRYLPELVNRIFLSANSHKGRILLSLVYKRQNIYIKFTHVNYELRNMKNINYISKYETFHVCLPSMKHFMYVNQA